MSNLQNCSTVIWNGPVGAFEEAPFDISSSTIARSIAGLSQYGNLKSVIGGGDVVSCVNKTGLISSYTYVSTGGGAFLKWIENKSLVGVTALRQEQEKARVIIASLQNNARLQNTRVQSC